MTKTLNTANFARIVDAAIVTAEKHGHAYYGWKDDPATDLDRSAADAVWKSKLNGAYGERLLASLGMLDAVVRHGYPVRFVQFEKEEVPFDATGWTAVAVGGKRGWWAFLHLAPWDFLAEGLNDLVEVIEENNPDNGFIPWVELQPTKPAEYGALLRAAQGPGIDLIEEIDRISRKEKSLS